MQHMAAKSTASSKKRARRQPPASSILDQLQPAEGAAVLGALLITHPELRSEAEAAARATLAEVSFLSIAESVETDILQLDYDDLNGRAGGIRGATRNPPKPHGSCWKRRWSRT